MVHPRSVNVVKLDGRVVDEDSLRSVQLFFAAYLFIALGATLLVSVDNFSFGTTFTAVVSCIGNVGPGLELVGPMGNYSAFSGFSTRNLSIAAYESPAIEVIITLFMLVFSINFALYFLLLCGKVRQALRSDELRFFLAVVAFSTLLISINIWPMYPADGSAVRHAAFQVGSIISTTGFASTDFNLWPEFSRILLVLLMFIGACAGSTGGAIKCSRVLLLLKCIRREIR